MSVDAIIKIFSKTLHVPAVSLPRHNSSAQLPDELIGNLLSAPLIWVRRGGVIPPLQPLYDGPYTVLRLGPRSFTIRVGSRDEVIAVSHLKACTAPADATPGSPRRRGRPPGSHPGGPAGFYTFPSGADTRRSRNHFPTWRGGFCTPGTGSALTGATDTVPVPSTGTAQEVGPLTSSPCSQGQSSGGALWTPAYIPSRRSDYSDVLQQPWTVHVQCLYIS
jgi:hypothetical protein